MTLKCVVIDDELLARECITGYIAEVDFLELAGSGSNPLGLVQLLDSQPVDLVFLDIQMPVMNGDAKLCNDCDDEREVYDAAQPEECWTEPRRQIFYQGP